MSEERDNEHENTPGPQAGAPVEQTDPTDTQVLAAVERNSVTPTETGAAAGAEANASADAQAAAPVHSDAATSAEATATGVDAANQAERPKIAAFLEPPSATEVESAGDIFATNAPNGAPPPPPADVAGPAEPAAVVAPPVAPAAAPLPPVRDGEIRISADHPMAALYMQTPMPPETKGNRGAGVLIALLATVVFALIYAGVIALWQAPNLPPSRFLDEGLLPWVLNSGFAAAVLSFFVGLTILVLIVGKAGWWAYVIFSLLVAAGVWASTVFGYALGARFAGETVSLHPYVLAVDLGLLFPAIAAGLVAREVAVWFGAWIGARGRRVKRQNAEAVVEYEKALTEAQAKQQ